MAMREMLLTASGYQRAIRRPSLLIFDTVVGIRDCSTLMMTSQSVSLTLPIRGRWNHCSVSAVCPAAIWVAKRRTLLRGWAGEGPRGTAFTPILGRLQAMLSANVSG